MTTKANVAEYIEKRVRPRLDWYDRRAVVAKRTHLGLEYFSAATSVILVVLLHVESVPRLVLAIMAASVAIAVTAGRIGQFGSLWSLYRLAGESLKAEEQLFLHGAGPYSGHAAADELFVERVEHLLGTEATRWEAVLVAGRGSSEERRFPPAA